MYKLNDFYKVVSRLFGAGALVFFVSLCFATSISVWTPSVQAESRKAPVVKRKVKKQKTRNKAVNVKGARGVKAKKQVDKKRANKKPAKIAKNGVSGTKRQKNKPKKTDSNANKKKGDKANQKALNKEQLLKRIRGKDKKANKQADSKVVGRSGKQARLRQIMNDPKASSADRGWLKNDARHVKNGNKSGLRVPRNGRKSPGRKGKDKGYELAHPHNKPASKGNGYAGAKLKNHADHKVETRLQRKRY